ncbi:MAG: hypothetical protein ACP5U0_10100 [Caldisphaera sp.]
MRIKLLIGLERLDIEGEEKLKGPISFGEFTLMPATESILNYIEIKDVMLNEMLKYITITEYELNSDDFIIDVKEMHPELKNKKYSITEYDDVVQINAKGLKIVITKELYLGGDRFIDEPKIVQGVIQNKVGPFITAFHLYKSGFVNPFPIVIEFIRDDGVKVSPIILGIYISNLMVREGYFLSYDELGKFSKFLTDNIDILSKTIKNEPAFSYFNRGLIDEDLSANIMWYTDNKFSILDYIAGMESLFKIHDELKYRLSLYVAHALANNYEERIKYKELISNLYDIRSKIAHGVNIGKTEEELEQGAEVILRQLLNIYLLQYLAKGKNKEDFIEEIERKILS